MAKSLTLDQADRYAGVLEECGVTAVVENEGELLAIELAAPESSPPAQVSVSEPQPTIRRLADYQKASGVLWIILAVIQVLTTYGIFAGLWNLLVGVMRIKMSRRIKARDSSVPAQFQGVSGLVIVGLINLVLGGVIGVLLVGFDFFVRDKILSNQQLFDQAPLVEEVTDRRQASRRARAAAKGY